MIVKLRSYDERLLAAVVVRRQDWLDWSMVGITYLGGAWFTIAFAFLMASGLVPGTRAAGIHAVQTLAVSHIIAQLLKRTVTRQRPQLPIGFAFLAEPPDRFSFPSGHATAALAIALPIAGLLPLIAAIALLGTALLVGVSRCYLGVHYPGDVVVGWLVAWATFMVL